jgi:hypothetical protein
VAPGFSRALPVPAGAASARRLAGTTDFTSFLAYVVGFNASFCTRQFVISPT